MALRFDRASPPAAALLGETMGESDDLSFAFPAATTKLPCSRCGNALSAQYWDWQGKAVCTGCRAALEEEVASAKSATTFAKAALLGGGTALGCGLVYAAFVAATDFQLALITIGIAFLVGRVVRGASRGLGGLRYQILAVALTYVASTMGYAPALWSALTQPQDPLAAPPNDADLSADAIGGEAQTAQIDGAPDTADAQVPSVVEFVLAVGMLLGLMLASPFLLITDAPIGFLIVCLGLWEAWKQLRPIGPVLAGPFELQEAPASGASDDGDALASESHATPPPSTV